MIDAIDRKILKMLEKNARTPYEDIAAVNAISTEEAKERVKALEAAGVIRAYKGVIDWERVDSDRVSAIIELKVTPKAGFGFEEVAQRVAKYPEVESVSLMSGAFDLNVVVKGKTFHEVSNFVAKELSVIDSVTSTGTQFVMRRYKEFNVELTSDDEDERGKISL
jgi:DNA-binding Lrp family transcriptional regulator